MSPPPIAVRNAQRAVRFDVQKLQQFAEGAVSAVWQYRQADSDILILDAVAVSIVSDAKMRQLHAQFSGNPSLTDVLTFQHGDIAISVETARRNARTFHSSTAEELKLYLVHGLLHLCGFDDRKAPARRCMQQMQTRLLRQLRRRFEAESSRVSFGG